MTIMLAWSAEDAGKIIETYKRYEAKPPDDIMERSNTAPHQKVIILYFYIHSVKKKKKMYMYIYINICCS